MMGGQADGRRENGVLPAGIGEVMEAWPVAGAEMSTTVDGELTAVTKGSLGFARFMVAVKAGHEESGSTLAVARRPAGLRNRDKRRGRHR